MIMIMIMIAVSSFDPIPHGTSCLLLELQYSAIYITQLLLCPVRRACMRNPTQAEDSPLRLAVNREPSTQQLLSGGLRVGETDEMSQYRQKSA
jgi:hypothetical protein